MLEIDKHNQDVEDENKNQIKEKDTIQVNHTEE